MTNQIEPKKTGPPPLWTNPKPGAESVLGTCARCTKVARLLSEMSTNIKQDPACGSCKVINATHANFKEME